MSRNRIPSKIPSRTKDSTGNESFLKRDPAHPLPKEKTSLSNSESQKKSAKSTSKQENSRKKSHKPRTSIPEPVIEDENYNYEDDFEDYSDDFEEEEEDKKEERGQRIQEIQGTPSHQHEVQSSRIISPPSQSPLISISKQEKMDEQETPMMRRLKSNQGPRPLLHIEQERKAIVKEDRTTSATQRTLSLIPSGPMIMMNFGDNENQKKRHQTLRHLIGIESIPIRILEKPPVKDYNLYLEMFGDNGKVQAYSQTGDDDINEETQTEDREIQYKWTQHPPIDHFGWGTDAQNGLNQFDLQSDDPNIFKVNHLQDLRLKQFVEASAQVIIELINSKNRGGKYIEMQHRSDLAFSAGYNSFGLDQLANDSSVRLVLRPPHEDQRLLCAFFIKDSLAKDISQKSLIVEFFVDGQKSPQRIFVCEGEIKCGTYAPDGTVLFAGLMDGSCVAWDLLEPTASFVSSIPWPESEDEIPLRTPAYDTSFLSNTFSSSSKSASAIHITTISRPRETTYQVACLDESGTISVWSVLRDANTASNLGTRPDARLAMGLTALLRPDHLILSANSNPTFLMANCMISNQKDPFHFIVGTDIGFLMTLSRTKGATYAGPRLYKANMNVFGEVLCLRNSPFDLDVFAAGLSSGNLSIHKTNHSSPLLVLTPPQEARYIVSTIEWSPSCASILYSIHGGSTIVTWDLGKGQQPVSISKFAHFPSKILCSDSWFAKPSASSAGIGYMAIGYENGQIQLHALENVKPIVDSSLKNITQILKKSGAFV